MAGMLSVVTDSLNGIVSGAIDEANRKRFAEDGGRFDDDNKKRVKRIIDYNDGSLNDRNSRIGNGNTKPVNNDKAQQLLNSLNRQSDNNHLSSTAASTPTNRDKTHRLLQSLNNRKAFNDDNTSSIPKQLDMENIFGSQKRPLFLTLINTKERSKPAKKTTRKPVEISIDDFHGNQNEYHAHLLATKWLNSSSLKELEQNEGLRYKKGKFSAIEEQLLKDAIEAFRIAHDYNEDDILSTIFDKSCRNSKDGFWTEIAFKIPQRPKASIYHRVQKLYHPYGNKGPWSKEEDELLSDGILKFGKRWTKIADYVQRTPLDCTDRYRLHLSNLDRAKGPWTQEECDKLSKLVLEMKEQDHYKVHNEIFWTVISQKLKTRSPHQCRIKWNDSLDQKHRNNYKKVHWTSNDTRNLINRIIEGNFNDDTEINYRQIGYQDWNNWSARTLRSFWRKIQSDVNPNWKEMRYSG